MIAFSLAVCNPGGRDREQHFPGGAGAPDLPGAPHPPVNFHAFAACTDGSFHVRLDTALATARPILLLLRTDLRPALRALRRFKKASRLTVVTFKEAGSAQIAARLRRPADLRLLAEIFALADGCLAPTPFLSDFFEVAPLPTSASPRPEVEFIPTPYPVDDTRWDFSLPPVRRRGIFVGTREFDVPSRQHLAALCAARFLHAATGEPVTVINPDGRRGAKLLAALGFSTKPDADLLMVPGPLPYLDYLRTIARHRLVFQLDRSAVPGQVAGDALLCRVPCVGGDGAIEQMVFPDLAGHDKEPARLVGLAADLLRDPTHYEHAWREAQTRAMEAVSFQAVAARLASFYTTLEAKRRL